MKGNRRFTLKAGVLALGLATVLVLPSAAEAGPILTFEFQGHVTELDSNLGFFGPFFTAVVGDTFTGHFSYELGPTNPDQLPADTEIGRYAVLELVVDQSVLPPFTNARIAVFHHMGLASLDPLGPPTGVDRLVVFAEAPGSAYVNGIRIVLEAPFGTVFSDDSLPTNIDLAQFPFAILAANKAVGIHPFPSTEDVGELSALGPAPVVPEPSTLALSLLAIGGFLARRRSRR